MARQLTPEQREARKRATSARNKAHTARRRELAAVEDPIKEALEAEHNARAQPLRDAEALLELEYQASVADIDKQIAKLQARKQLETENMHRARATLRVPLDQSYQEMRNGLRALAERMDTEFPDIKGHARYSAACWKPIEDFL